MSRKDEKNLKKVCPFISPHSFGGNMEKYKSKLLTFRDRNETERASKGMIEEFHVLVDVNTRRKIKQVAMSRAEARRRNKTIRELGMAWSLGTL